MRRETFQLASYQRETTGVEGVLQQPGNGGLMLDSDIEQLGRDAVVVVAPHLDAMQPAGDPAGGLLCLRQGGLYLLALLHGARLPSTFAQPSEPLATAPS
ncbi:hypothetical protein JQK15_26190 [Sphingobium sp. BHU LFT2]|uniref:hypothetical protein n=1 Tax=Sphingobium sp. BHU LFT2 TaxID=2807634 RepID=UPI001BEBAC98|nr:hypothetical protein [Sphingobium sp. BHU LFT2]MBT2246988.1 hypothetical protein [Sphingobium sp. BHU LFT2]